MAFTKDSLMLISNLYKSGIKIQKILSFGYPIILIEPKAVESLFNVDIESKDLVNTENSNRIRKIHKKNSNDKFVDTNSLFNKLGAEFFCLDILKHYGPEIIHDLNYPVPSELSNKIGVCNLCIDPGTIEHIFNCSQALMTLYEFLDVDGYAVHCSCPVSPNHGLWNPQEKLFLRFYQANNCEIIFSEKYWVENNKKEPFTPKRYPIKYASEVRSTFMARKTHFNTIAYPKDY